MAAMDEDGYAHFAAIENLASRARVTVEAAKIAIDTFLAPDPNSSNPEHKGRRIERVPGGYLILNAKVYRELATKLQQKEQTRVRVAAHRSKNQGKRKKSVTPRYTPLPSASAYASAFGSDSEGKEYEENQSVTIQEIKPTIEDALKWLAFSKENNSDYTEQETRSAFNALAAGGWKWGKRDVADWRAALERQISTDRDRKGGNGSPGIGKRPLSPMDIKTIISAKDQLSKELRAKHSEEDGNWGARWKDDAKKQEYITIRKEIKKLNEQLSNMAL